MVLLQMMEMLSQTNSIFFLINAGTVLANSIASTDKNPVDYIQQDVINTLYLTLSQKMKLVKSLVH